MWIRTIIFQSILLLSVSSVHAQHNRDSSASYSTPSVVKSSFNDRFNIGGGLSGRGVQNKPEIHNKFQKTGTVVVNVCAERNGNVTKASFTQRGSTSNDSNLIKIAESNALEFKFLSSNIDEQCGTITYNFKNDQVSDSKLKEEVDIGSPPPVMEVAKKDEIFTRVEHMPQFGSGEKELLEYLSKSIIYPLAARENGIQGTVVVQFVIDKYGRVTVPVIVREVGGGCDEEALRVINNMPKWNPGKHQGQVVNVSYTMPIRFRLE